MKPIDGEQLEEIIYKYYCKSCREKGLDRCRGCKVTNILGFMKKLCGKVEAKPVVHARWVDVNPNLHIGMKCSLCGARIKYSEFFNGNHRYCHKCGAQMDEEEGAQK